MRKSKSIPVASENMRKGKKSWAVHSEGLSFLLNTGASHCVINQPYVNNFQEDFRHNYITYKTAGGDYKLSTISRLISRNQNFLKQKLLTIDFISVHQKRKKWLWYDHRTRPNEETRHDYQLQERKLNVGWYHRTYV